MIVKKKYKETKSLLEKSLELAIYHYQFDIDHGFNIGESWEIKSQFSKLSNKGSTYKSSTQKVNASHATV